jgi:hypothetical protein
MGVESNRPFEQNTQSIADEDKTGFDQTAMIRRSSAA